MLFLARVVSSDEHDVVVVKFHQPGFGIVSFASGAVDAEEEDETFSWEDVIEMQWRPVPSHLDEMRLE